MSYLFIRGPMSVLSVRDLEWFANDCRDGALRALAKREIDKRSIAPCAGAHLSHCHGAAAAGVACTVGRNR